MLTRIIEPEEGVMLRFRTTFTPTIHVTFKWNIRLDLSGGAATKTLCSLVTELVLQVLGESTGTMTVWVIRGDEGMGDIPGIRGGFRGVCRFCAILDSIDTRTQT